MTRYQRSTRRKVLETGSAGLATLAAGCLGGDDSTSSPSEDPSQGEDNPDTGSQETEPESEPEDYDTPESEHIDTKTLVEDWGRVYSDHERVGVDSFSPSQISEQYDTNFIEANGEQDRYSILPFSHEDVPETITQETPGNNTTDFVKVDQLPSGASTEDVASALEEEGYELQDEVGEFSIYTTVDEREARAVGEGKHIIALNVEGAGPASNVHQEHLNDLLESYRSDGTDLDSDMQDLLDTLEVRDTFSAYRDLDFWTDFVGGISGEQPSAAAVTVDADEDIKYGAWKFNNEEAAQQAYEDLSGSNGRVSNGFTQVDQEGRYLTAAGGFSSEQAFDNRFKLSQTLI